MSKELEKLQAQKKKLEAKIQAAKTKETRQKRKDDTRLKVLIGSYVLNQLNNGHQITIGGIEGLQGQMMDFIKRDNDKKFVTEMFDKGIS